MNCNFLFVVFRMLIRCCNTQKHNTRQHSWKMLMDLQPCLRVSHVRIFALIVGKQLWTVYHVTHLSRIKPAKRINSDNLAGGNLHEQAPSKESTHAFTVSHFYTWINAIQFSLWRDISFARWSNIMNCGCVFIHVCSCVCVGVWLCRINVYMHYRMMLVYWHVEANTIKQLKWICLFLFWSTAHINTVKLLE